MKLILNIIFAFLIFNITSQIPTSKFKSSSTKSLYNTALEFRQNGDFETSNSILKTILLSQSESNFKSTIYYKIANNYFSLNKTDSSLFFLYKILESDKSDLKVKSKSHFLIASNYSNINDYEKAKQNLEKSINYMFQIGNKIGIGKCYNSIGELDFKRNNYIKALSYFNKAKVIFEKSNSLDYQITLSNIGASYIHLAKPEKALPYIKESEVLAIKLDDQLGVSIATNNLATIYRDLNQKDSALFFYHKALQMVDELGSKEEKKTILLNLSELYDKKGNLSEAYKYFKEYTILKDELFNTERNEFIVETQEKYQATERQKDLAEMKLKVQKKDATHKQFIFTFTIVSIVVLIIFLSIIAWFRWKSIQQKNRAELEVVTATMRGEEKQRLKISQEIHDDLGGILGMCRMLFTKGKQYFATQNQELFDRVDSLLVQASNRSRAISHELFSPTLKQFGLFSAIQELITDLQLSNPDLEIIFSMEDFRLNEQLELNCFRITQELFTNTIKYANASRINLEINTISNTLQYEYTDNGIGFDLSSIKKGVGLNSIEARVKSFNGNLNYLRSTKGFGTKISFNNFQKL